MMVDELEMLDALAIAQALGEKATPLGDLNQYEVEALIAEALEE